MTALLRLYYYTCSGHVLRAAPPARCVPVRLLPILSCEKTLFHENVSCSRELLLLLPPPPHARAAGTLIARRRVARKISAVSLFQVIHTQTHRQTHMHLHTRRRTHTHTQTQVVRNPPPSHTIRQFAIYTSLPPGRRLDCVLQQKMFSRVSSGLRRVKGRKHSESDCVREVREKRLPKRGRARLEQLQLAHSQPS